MFKGKSTHLDSTGSTDFDGDNKTDVFRTFLRGDGSLQWQYSSGGTGPWQDLAFASGSLPTTELQFGDFNGDTKTDVFATLFSTVLSAYQWLYSPSGTDSFVTLNTTAIFPNRLALGDFDGDGKTDVFTATQSGATYQWSIFPGGNGGKVDVAFAATLPSLLRFGDFDGDARTDVFAATQQADGSTQWLYSSGGAASFANLATTTVPYSELKFGDFDGDGKTDVLAALPRPMAACRWSTGRAGSARRSPWATFRRPRPRCGWGTSTATASPTCWRCAAGCRARWLSARGKPWRLPVTALFLGP